MQPAGMPPQPKRLTQEALNKEFSFKFSRAELNIIYNLVNNFPVNVAYSQLKSPAMMQTMSAMENIIRTIEGAVTALSNQDYEPDEKANGVVNSEIAL